MSPARTRDSSKKRDADRSRREILDAAEAMFANRGYDGASLAGIGELADVSATLPAYFFGDKPQLYRSVITRLFEDRDEALAPVVAEAIACLDGSEEGVSRGIEAIVVGYLEFLRKRTAFLQLMARDALEGEDPIHQTMTSRHSSVFQSGVRNFLDRVGLDDAPAFDADQLLISIVALCFFPLEHDTTMLASMGYRARTPAFTERRAKHVVDLIMRALRNRTEPSVTA